VKKHTVVIGYGMKGRSAVGALIDQGYPADHIVVVDSDGTNIKGSCGNCSSGAGLQLFALLLLLRKLTSPSSRR